jgi:hypothetical protein
MERTKGTVVGLFILGAAMLFLPAWGVAGVPLKGEPVGTHVHCGGAITIGGALARTQPIRAHGICREVLSISATRVSTTIIGDGDNVNAHGGSACAANAGANATTIISNDPSAPEIVNIQGKNITITALNVTSLRGDDPSISPPLDPKAFDKAQCVAAKGSLPPTGDGSDAQDPACSNNRGIRLQRNGIALLGRNTRDSQILGGVDSTLYVEQTGVCIFNVGSNGVEATQGSVLRLINSEVRNAGGDGVVVTDGSASGIGSSSGSELKLPSDAYHGPGHVSGNIIHDNSGVGITVDRLGQSRILSAFIYNNGADGIRVRRNSQADISGSVINNNGANGIRVDDNSNVSLGATFGNNLPTCPSDTFGAVCQVLSGSFISPANLSNTTTAANLGSFGVKCTIGGSVSGKLSTDRGGGATPLVGSGSGANLTGHTAGMGSFGTTTSDNCIDKTN